MALATREVELVLIARDRASPVLARLGGSFAGVSRNLGRATGLISRQLTMMTNEYIQFTQKSALAFTQVENVANATQKAIEESTKKIARSIPRELQQIQDAYYDLFSTIDVKNMKQAEQAVTQFAKAATTGQAPMESITRSTIGWLNALDQAPTLKNVNKLLNIQFELVRKGAGTYEEITREVGKAIPAIVKANQSVETFAGSFAFLTRNALNSAMAATSVARATELLYSRKAAEGLRKYGIALSDATGKTREMVDIIQDMLPFFRGKSIEQRVTVFHDMFGQGRIQARRFFDTVIPNFEEWKRLVEEMKEAVGEGVFEKNFAFMMEQPLSKWQLLVNRFQVFRLELGENIWKDVNKYLIPALDKVLKWWEELTPASKKAVTQITLFGTALLGLTSILFGVLSALTLLVAMVTSFPLQFGAAGIALGVFGTSLKNILPAFKDNWDVIRTKIEDTISKSVTAVQDGNYKIWGLWKSLFRDLGRILGIWTPEIQAKWNAAFQDWISPLKWAWDSTIGAIHEMITDSNGKIRQAYKDLFKEITTGLIGVAGYIFGRDPLTKLFSAGIIISQLDDMAPAIKQWYKTTGKDDLKKVFTNLGSGIRDMLENELSFDFGVGAIPDLWSEGFIKYWRDEWNKHISPDIARAVESFKKWWDDKGQEFTNIQFDKIWETAISTINAVIHSLINILKTIAYIFASFSGVSDEQLRKLRDFENMDWNLMITSITDPITSLMRLIQSVLSTVSGAISFNEGAVNSGMKELAKQLESFGPKLVRGFFGLVEATLGGLGLIAFNSTDLSPAIKATVEQIILSVHSLLDKIPVLNWFIRDPNAKPEDRSGNAGPAIGTLKKLPFALGLLGLGGLAGYGWLRGGNAFKGIGQGFKGFFKGGLAGGLGGAGLAGLAHILLGLPLGAMGGFGVTGAGIGAIAGAGKGFKGAMGSPIRGARFATSTKFKERIIKKFGIETPQMSKERRKAEGVSAKASKLAGDFIPPKTDEAINWAMRNPIGERSKWYADVENQYKLDTVEVTKLQQDFDLAKKVSDGYQAEVDRMRATLGTDVAAEVATVRSRIASAMSSSLTAQNKLDILNTTAFGSRLKVVDTKMRLAQNSLEQIVSVMGKDDALYQNLGEALQRLKTIEDDLKARGAESFYDKIVAQIGEENIVARRAELLADIAGARKQISEITEAGRIAAVPENVLLKLQEAAKRVNDLEVEAVKLTNLVDNVEIQEDIYNATIAKHSAIADKNTKLLNEVERTKGVELEGKIAAKETILLKKQEITNKAEEKLLKAIEERDTRRATGRQDAYDRWKEADKVYRDNITLRTRVAEQLIKRFDLKMRPVNPAAVELLEDLIVFVGLEDAKQIESLNKFIKGKFLKEDSARLYEALGLGSAKGLKGTTMTKAVEDTLRNQLRILKSGTADAMTNPNIPEVGSLDDTLKRFRATGAGDYKIGSLVRAYVDEVGGYNNAVFEEFLERVNAVTLETYTDEFWMRDFWNEYMDELSNRISLGPSQFSVASPVPVKFEEIMKFSELHAGRHFGERAIKNYMNDVMEIYRAQYPENTMDDFISALLKHMDDIEIGYQNDAAKELYELIVNSWERRDFFRIGTIKELDEIIYRGSDYLDDLKTYFSSEEWYSLDYAQPKLSTFRMDWTGLNVKEFPNQMFGNWGSNIRNMFEEAMPEVDAIVARNYRGVVNYVLISQEAVKRAEEAALAFVEGSEIIREGPYFDDLVEKVRTIEYGGGTDLLIDQANSLATEIEDLTHDLLENIEEFGQFGSRDKITILEQFAELENAIIRYGNLTEMINRNYPKIHVADLFFDLNIPMVDGDMLDDILGKGTPMADAMPNKNWMDLPEDEFENIIYEPQNMFEKKAYKHLEGVEEAFVARMYEDAVELLERLNVYSVENMLNAYRAGASEVGEDLKPIFDEYADIWDTLEQRYITELPSPDELLNRFAIHSDDIMRNAEILDRIIMADPLLDEAKVAIMEMERLVDNLQVDNIVEALKNEARTVEEFIMDVNDLNRVIGDYTGIHEALRTAYQFTETGVGVPVPFGADEFFDRIYKAANEGHDNIKEALALTNKTSDNVIQEILDGIYGMTDAEIESMVDAYIETDGISSISGIDFEEKAAQRAYLKVIENNPRLEELVYKAQDIFDELDRFTVSSIMEVVKRGRVTLEDFTDEILNSTNPRLLFNKYRNIFKTVYEKLGDHTQSIIPHYKWLSGTVPINMEEALTSIEQARTLLGDTPQELSTIMEPGNQGVTTKLSDNSKKLIEDFIGGIDTTLRDIIEGTIKDVNLPLIRTISEERLLSLLDELSTGITETYFDFDELVKAVKITKQPKGRLRRISAQISNLVIDEGFSALDSLEDMGNRMLKVLTTAHRKANKALTESEAKLKAVEDLSKAMSFFRDRSSSYRPAKGFIAAFPLGHIFRGAGEEAMMSTQTAINRTGAFYHTLLHEWVHWNAKYWPGKESSIDVAGTDFPKMFRTDKFEAFVRGQLWGGVDFHDMFKIGKPGETQGFFSDIFGRGEFSRRRDNIEHAKKLRTKYVQFRGAYNIFTDFLHAGSLLLPEEELYSMLLRFIDQVEIDNVKKAHLLDVFDKVRDIHFRHPMSLDERFIRESIEGQGINVLDSLPIKEGRMMTFSEMANEWIRTSRDNELSHKLRRYILEYVAEYEPSSYREAIAGIIDKISADINDRAFMNKIGMRSEFQKLVSETDIKYGGAVVGVQHTVTAGEPFSGGSGEYPRYGIGGYESTSTAQWKLTKTEDWKKFVTFAKQGSVNKYLTSLGPPIESWEEFITIVRAAHNELVDSNTRTVETIIRFIKGELLEVDELANIYDNILGTGMNTRDLRATFLGTDQQWVAELTDRISRRLNNILAAQQRPAYSDYSFIAKHIAESNAAGVDALKTVIAHLRVEGIQGHRTTFEVAMSILRRTTDHNELTKLAEEYFGRGTRHNKIGERLARFLEDQNIIDPEDIAGSISKIVDEAGIITLDKFRELIGVVPEQVYIDPMLVLENLFGRMRELDEQADNIITSLKGAEAEFVIPYLRAYRESDISTLNSLFARVPNTIDDALPKLTFTIDKMNKLIEEVKEVHIPIGVRPSEHIQTESSWFRRLGNYFDHIIDRITVDTADIADLSVNPLVEFATAADEAGQLLWKFDVPTIAVTQRLFELADEIKEVTQVAGQMKFDFSKRTIEDVVKQGIGYADWGPKGKGIRGQIIDVLNKHSLEYLNMMDSTADAFVPGQKFITGTGDIWEVIMARLPDMTGELRPGEHKAVKLVENIFNRYLPKRGEEWDRYVAATKWMPEEGFVKHKAAFEWSKQKQRIEREEFREQQRARKAGGGEPPPTGPKATGATAKEPDWLKWMRKEYQDPAHEFHKEWRQLLKIHSEAPLLGKKIPKEIVNKLTEMGYKIPDGVNPGRLETILTGLFRRPSFEEYRTGDILRRRLQAGDLSWDDISGFGKADRFKKTKFYTTQAAWMPKWAYGTGRKFATKLLGPLGWGIDILQELPGLYRELNAISMLDKNYNIGNLDQIAMGLNAIIKSAVSVFTLGFFKPEEMTEQKYLDIIYRQRAIASLESTGVLGGIRSQYAEERLESFQRVPGFARLLGAPKVSEEEAAKESAIVKEIKDIAMNPYLKSLFYQDQRERIRAAAKYPTLISPDNKMAKTQAEMLDEFKQTPGLLEAIEKEIHLLSDDLLDAIHRASLISQRDAGWYMRPENYPMDRYSTLSGVDARRLAAPDMLRRRYADWEVESIRGRRDRLQETLNVFTDDQKTYLRNLASTESPSIVDYMRYHSTYQDAYRSAQQQILPQQLSAHHEYLEQLSERRANVWADHLAHAIASNDRLREGFGPSPSQYMLLNAEGKYEPTPNPYYDISRAWRNYTGDRAYQFDPDNIAEIISLYDDDKITQTGLRMKGMMGSIKESVAHWLKDGIISDDEMTAMNMLYDRGFIQQTGIIDAQIKRQVQIQARGWARSRTLVRDNLGDITTMLETGMLTQADLLETGLGSRMQDVFQRAFTVDNENLWYNLIQFRDLIESGQWLPDEVTTGSLMSLIDEWLTTDLTTDRIWQLGYLIGNDIVDGLDEGIIAGFASTLEGIPDRVISTHIIHQLYGAGKITPAQYERLLGQFGPEIKPEDNIRAGHGNLLPSTAGLVKPLLDFALSPEADATIKTMTSFLEIGKESTVAAVFDGLGTTFTTEMAESLKTAVQATSKMKEDGILDEYLRLFDELGIPRHEELVTAVETFASEYTSHWGTVRKDAVKTIGILSALETAANFNESHSPIPNVVIAKSLQKLANIYGVNLGDLIRIVMNTSGELKDFSSSMVTDFLTDATDLRNTLPGIMEDAMNDTRFAVGDGLTLPTDIDTTVNTFVRTTDNIDSLREKFKVITTPKTTTITATSNVAGIKSEFDNLITAINNANPTLRISSEQPETPGGDGGEEPTQQYPTPSGPDSPGPEQPTPSGPALPSGHGYRPGPTFTDSSGNTRHSPILNATMLALVDDFIAKYDKWHKGGKGRYNNAAYAELKTLRGQIRDWVKENPGLRKPWYDDWLRKNYHFDKIKPLVVQPPPGGGHDGGGNTGTTNPFKRSHYRAIETLIGNYRTGYFVLKSSSQSGNLAQYRRDYESAKSSRRQAAQSIAEEKYNNLVNTLKGMAKTTGVGGDTVLTSARLSLLAAMRGGIVTKPMLSLIGEAGPEAIIPLSRLRHLETAPGARALPPEPTINNYHELRNPEQITIEVGDVRTDADPQEIANEIMWQLRIT